MPVKELALLDTSVVIDPPADYRSYAAAVCISAVSIGELAFGLHTPDPLLTAGREEHYRKVLATYDPIPYDSAIAHEFGAIAATVRNTGRNPRSRTADLMIAATARSIGAIVLTRNPGDFRGLDGIVTVVEP